MYFGCHFIIQRRHDLVEHFHQFNLQTQFHQVFSYFQTDKAAAHNHCFLRLLDFDPLDNSIQLRDIMQHENAFMVNARQRRNDGAGSGGEQQFVVGFCVIALI